MGGATRKKVYLAILILYSTMIGCKSEVETPSYVKKMVMNASELPLEDYYDYIIVGGGTAGCPLGATLSHAFRVLVLERGGLPHSNPNLITQEGFLTTLLTANAALDSPAQPFISEDGVPNARGRVLGGSSAINAGFYSRAHHDFFSRSGLSWDLDIVNRSYQWVEKQIVFKPRLNSWQSAFRNALLDAGVNPYNGFTLDHAIGTKIGGSTFDASGTRHTSADLLLHAKPSNINVAVYATVERLLFAASVSGNPTATGVLFSDQTGRYHHAMLRQHGEVILSAGAIGSPQLLLLSGIGPRSYLSSWGIPVVHHVPYVGHFLYDNPRNGITILPSQPMEHSLIQVVGITDSGAYLETASNVIPFALPRQTVFVRAPSSPLYLTVTTLISKISGPISSGFLRLASMDVRVNPVVRFNYFNNRVDVERCVNGTRKIGEVLGSRALNDFKFRNWLGEREFIFVGPPLPPDQRDYSRMAEFCRRTVSTIWHYHGGCVVGRVVDSNLKVIGVSSLRIVDGSVFGVSPGTNPQATLMMLGRYFGLKIIRERGKLDE
ncbi:hypothetical protein RJT34_16852 [Clitoria ternatea]|uniref:Glucose-methanol-choline oxidoreductase N-terminal domain-containing protein n=1 Tax=Clitoria ternatea TaxID=43366 RepID=A0AAN9J927_CLITE